ncbi:MAG: restriction endonuclease [Novosphingobium sp.]
MGEGRRIVSFPNISESAMLAGKLGWRDAVSMNFRSLDRLVQSADEADFYAVALYFLEALGYRNPTIVDGPYDGGRDVVCDRSDLRIQLSVQRKWEDKLRREAGAALSEGKRHLIFVTNRRITQAARTAFFASFKLKGQIEITIHDSQSISSRLLMPSKIGKAFSLLGVEIRPRLVASEKDIAVSTVLLFGTEASALRDEVVEAVVASWLRKNGPANEMATVENASKFIPGAQPQWLIGRAISRLRAKGEISGSQDRLLLEKSAADRIDAAEAQILAARQADEAMLIVRFGLSSKDAATLMGLSIAALTRRMNGSWSSQEDEELAEFIARTVDIKVRSDLNECISSMDTFNLISKVSTIDRLFSTNTFNIHMALGKTSEINLTLDASVALPMMFGLEFGAVSSRWSSAAALLRDLAVAHNFSIVLPRPYLNEMAAHGQKALEYSEIYEAFSPELRKIMRESRNAYISHYARMVDEGGNLDGIPFGIRDFLQSFGIRKDVSVKRTEDKIESILSRHGISCVWNGFYDKSIREEISELKVFSSKHVVDHDAAVITNLKKIGDVGYILATWDRIIINYLSGVDKIYADSPGKIVDWLSYIQGIDDDIGKSVEVLEALISVEDSAVSLLARKLDRVDTIERAYKLTAVIEEARAELGSKWVGDVGDLEELLHKELDQLPDESQSSVTGGYDEIVLDS